MSILDYAPRFSPDEAAQLAKHQYGLPSTVTPLPSERDQNFLLQSAQGEKFVLKIANGIEEHALLAAQNGVMLHVAKRISFCPQVISAKTGEEISIISAANAEYFVRLLTYLPGTPLGKVKYHSTELLYDLGQKVGRLTKALHDFDHPALHRDFHWDLANGQRMIRKNAPLIRDEALRDTVLQLAAAFETHTAPILPTLPKSIIHNDANDYNLITGGGNDPYTRKQSIVGLIDFGDMVFSYTVGDLAVAIAYAILDKHDPLSIAAQIIKGYHSARPLSNDELTTLFGLVTMRLCMSVCIAAEQQALQSDNKYLGISQAPIRTTLPKLADTHPRLAEAIFREACGLSPFPSSDKIRDWLATHPADFASPLDCNLHAGPVQVLDLSVASPLIDSDPDQNAARYLTPRIEATLAKSGAQVGLGRYDEVRYFYTAPAFATGERITDEYRTVHLGIDLFAPDGTPVYAPLEGRVIALDDNHASQDYGPVIILEHTAEAQTFYTLYGHLSRASLGGVKLGQRFQPGERLASIGGSTANGGWTPHLHFQVITDLLGLSTDFPGVAYPSQRQIWLGLCPDPNLILNIPAAKFPAREAHKTATLAKRRQRLGHNLSISYHKPLKIERGWKQYLFDEQGRKYLDAYNNVAHVGHNHPRVIAAAGQQMQVLNTNTRYLHDTILRYADKLTAMLPEPLCVCFFVNSGSEANELALRLARAYTGQRDLIVLDAAYHGNTTGMIDISPYKHNGPGGTGTPDWVHIAPIPDDYRGPYKRADLEAGAKYAQHVQEITAKLMEKGRGLSGYIAESLPSVGGQIILPPGYLQDVYRYVRATGGVCIADEVQTGFGRIGSHFWGFEMQGVIPDIVVLGKPIGNGHPLAAVVTTPEIAATFDNGMEYFNTFGGNPVSCAVGLAVLQVVLDENLQAHARRVGTHLLEGLHPFVERFPLVGDVRGSGLFLGMELVRDRTTLAPAAEEAGYVTNRLREHGILLGTDGPYHNVVKIRPPMPFDQDDAEFLVEMMGQVLSELDC